MARVDRLRGVVEDRRLDGTLEELLGMSAEELVERVVAGDVEREPPAPPPSRAPPLLSKARDRAGERDRYGGIELADVDAQLERARGDHAEQLALREAALDFAPLLGRIAGAVGRDPVRSFRGR